jgi:hypothetical protein
MVIVASSYLRFYIEVAVGVGKFGKFLPTPTPPKIPSFSDSTALHKTRLFSPITLKTFYGFQ